MQGMAVVGFDIGSENSYVCMAKGFGFDVVDNEFSHRYNMSILTFTEERRHYGLSADNNMSMNYAGSVKYIKNLIGLKFDDSFAQSEMAKTHCKFLPLPNGEIGVQVRYQNQDQVFSITQLMAMQLSHLKIVAQKHTDKQVVDCVVSVPCFFTEYQRRLMLDACHIAGLNCLRLLNEGTATCITMAVFRADWSDGKKIAMIDVGASNVTVTIAEVKKFGVKILSSVCTTTCSGREIDQSMYRKLSEDFLQQHQTIIELTNKAKLKLLKQCLLTKKKISMAVKMSHSIHIDCFMGDDLDFDCKICYDDLVNILGSNFEQQLFELFSQALQQAQLSVQQIEHVEMVGGASRFPLFTTLSEKYFGKAVSCSLNSDESVAKGCGVMSGIMSPFVKMKDIDMIDVMNHCVTITWQPTGSEKTSENKIFLPSAPLPITRALILYRKEDFEIQVLYPNEYPVRSERYIISGVYPDEAGAEQKITIKFRMDVNEILHVLDANLITKQLPTATANTLDSPVAAAVSSDQEPLAGDNTDGSSAAPSDASPESPAKQTTAAPASADKPKATHTVVPLKVTCCEGFCSENRQRELDRCIKIEKELLAQITAVEKRDGALNSLEELAYSTRDDISGGLRQFLAADVVVQVEEHVTSVFDWIDSVKYERCYTVEMCESRKMAIEKLILSGQSRQRFFQKAPEILQWTEDILVNSRNFIDQYRSGIAEYSHIKADIVDQVEMKMNVLVNNMVAIKSLLTASPEQRMSIQLPNLEECQKKLNEYHVYFNQVVATPKPKVQEPPKDAEASTPAPPDCEEGKPEDSQTNGSDATASSSSSS